MKKKLFIFTILITALLACNNEDIQLPSIDKQVNQTIEQSKSYQIPIDKALINLEEVLKIIDATTSQNGNKVKRSTRSVKNIETLVRKHTTNNPKGMQKITAQLAPETMLYLVNFDDEAGYAVLAADDRISSKVISIVDEGSISLDDFQTNYNDLSKEEGLEDFSLYNAEENDYYVGALAPVEQEALSQDLMYEYAEREIDNYVEPEPYSYSTSTVTDPWIVTKKIFPMLTTLWHQESPFNDNTPIKGFLTTPRHSPAGCIPIAIAQIMAYNEYPTYLTCNSIVCDWVQMKSAFNTSNIYSSYESRKGDANTQVQVANFVSTIGAWCETFYWVGHFQQYGFALPVNARNCMIKFGYSNAKRFYGYYEAQGKDMLESGKPFLIAANSGVTNGHAWVVDGSITREQNSRIVNNTTGETISSYTNNEFLVHCNWGWGGLSNGYYTSGVFKPKSGPIETEPGVDFNYSGDINSNFKWAFHMITY